MLRLSLNEICEALNKEAGAKKDSQVTSVVTDSRKVTPGSLFVALEGSRTDGANFVMEAIDRGAVACVVSSSKVPPVAPQEKVIEVEDPIKALGDLGCVVRKKLKCRTVAITGSVGKTTTKEILYSLLGVRYQVHRAPKSFNNHVGVPLTLFSTPPETQVLIAELGTNRPGEIKRLSSILQPHDGLILNVEPVHLEGLGSARGVAEEKSELLARLPPEGSVFLPSDIRFKEVFLEKAKGGVIFFGPGSKFWIRGWKRTGQSLLVDIAPFGVFRIKRCGAQHLNCVLAACAVCEKFGLSKEEMQEGFLRFEPPELRWEVRQSGSLRLILDCYNANPVSMYKALEEIRNHAPPEQVVVVLGDMKELGGESKHYHRELGKRLSRIGFRKVLLLGEEVRETYKVFCSWGDPESVELLEDRDSAVAALKANVRENDLVFFKASRSLNLEKIAEGFLRERKAQMTVARPT